MVLNPDGTVNALGFVDTYPLVAPSFVKDGYWKFNGGDINNVANWTELQRPFEQPLNDLFWTSNIWVTRGLIYRYEGFLYNCIQSHQTQTGFEPPNVPALFSLVPIPYAGENYPRWRQPLGSEDAYKVNDRVSWNGKDWTSNINANVFEPGVSQWTDLNAAPPATYPAWAPWPGSGPTYQIGDRVTHNGSTWEATVGNNVWEPGVFGWIQI
jgi:hypothetical protein